MRRGGGGGRRSGITELEAILQGKQSYKARARGEGVGGGRKRKSQGGGCEIHWKRAARIRRSIIFPRLRRAKILTLASVREVHTELRDLTAE